MARGKFITIEGSEGAGKSTALQFIQTYLAKANREVVWTREPGGTKVAEEIRKLVLHPMRSEEIMPETELLLMFAARTQHLTTCILPALNAGKWVICDRFIDATYAYQAGGRGIATEKITLLDKWIVGENYPDLTFLLDIEPQTGVMRAEKRGTEKDRIEEEKIDFFERVRHTYLARAAKDTSRIKIINANEPIVTVQNQIQSGLDVFLASLA